jgi:TatD DNase family protein
MHSYSASIDYTQSLLESNFVFGIGGPVTYKNGKDKQALVSALPIESMLLETDCPFLPPHPHRGKRNEPAYIPLIAQKIAEIRGMEVEDIGKQLTKNAGYLFNLDQILK